MIRDHMEARFWAEDGADSMTGIGKFLRELKIALDRLHAIEFDAPWRPRGRSAGR
jgi:hypothetical protein